MTESGDSVPSDQRRYDIWKGMASPDLQAQIERTEKEVLRDTGSKLLARIKTFETYTRPPENPDLT